MTRREWLASAALAPQIQPAGRRPNLMVILTDDHGYGDLGCYGAGDMRTPNLDSLAATGARFTQWYANAPVCAPSRAALMSGMYPAHAGVPDNGPALPPQSRSIATCLRQAGYTTGLFGKWHLGAIPPSDPNAHGFDRFFGFHSGCVDFYSHRFYWGEPRRVNYHDLWRDRTEVFEDGRYLTEMIGEEACQFVRDHRARPFFAYIPFNAPHYPMHAPRQYTDRFPNLEPDRRMYAAMVAAVDDQVGRILRTLEETGTRDNTLIFYASDNGATREPRAGLNGQPSRGGRNNGLRGNKFSLFDGGMHVPAIWNWPGRIAPGQVIAEPGMHMDVLPTMLRAAGVEPPAAIDGLDVTTMLTSGGQSPHDALYWSSGGQLAMRQGRWKMVYDGFEADGTAHDRQRLTGDDQLFLSDLSADPGETTNLRRKFPERAEEMLRQVQQWQWK